jgi:hypothetical protein
MSARLDETDRRIVGLAIPALGTLAAEPLYRIVDTAIVGRLGTDQLAGLAIAVTVLALVVAGSNFLTYGTTQRVANRLGSARPDQAADVGVQAMWLAGFVSVVAVPGARRRRTTAGFGPRRRWRSAGVRRRVPPDRGDRRAVRAHCTGSPRECNEARRTTGPRWSSSSRRTWPTC